MYLKITATGPEADAAGRLLGNLPAKLPITEPPSARLRLILEDSVPGVLTLTLLAYPEAASSWESSPRDLAIVDYVKSRVIALSPLFRSFLDGALGPALQPIVKHDLAHTIFDLQAELAPLIVGTGMPIRPLFEPLGYRVEIESPVFGLPAVLLRLIGRQSLADVVRHLFVLVPAMDKTKQAPLSVVETRRLGMLSTPWLAAHPKRQQVARSYGLKLPRLLSPPATP